jgi:hypothetical protein
MGCPDCGSGPGRPPTVYCATCNPQAWGPMEAAPTVTSGARAILYDVRLSRGQREAMMRLIRRLQDPTAPLDVTALANLLGAYLRLEIAERVK